MILDEKFTIKDYFTGIQVPENMTSFLVKESTNVQDVALPSTSPQQNSTQAVVGRLSLRVFLELSIALWVSFSSSSPDHYDFVIFKIFW